MTLNELTVLDLFSGIGGFSLAFESEGFCTIGFSEIDPYASAVLKKHWPNVPNYGDIRNVPAIRCDVLTGGFPCQPFSVAGKRRGASDDRALWPEMLAVIERCRPAFVLGENVPGIVNMELDSVLSDLESKGYTCRTFIVPACAVDARHRRDRVWIVANNAKWGRCLREPANARSGNKERRAQGQNRRCGCDVANADELQSRPELQSAGNHETGLRSASGTSKTSVADTNGHERHGRAGDVQVGRGGSTSETENDGISRSAQWCPEPAVGRVAHGIPNRSHRLKCLGNSIVPQVAQIFARAIKKSLTNDPQ